MLRCLLLLPLCALPLLGMRYDPPKVTHGPQIDVGTVEVFAVTDGGKIGDPLGCAHRIDSTTTEVWILKDDLNVHFPLAQSFIAMRLDPDPLMGITDDTLITTWLRAHAAAMDVGTTVTHKADLRDGMSGSGERNKAHDRTYWIHTLKLDEEGSIASDIFLGFAEIRKYPDGSFGETWILNAGVEFPLRRSFFAAYDETKPFTDVDDAGLVDAMKDKIRSLLVTKTTLLSEP